MLQMLTWHSVYMIRTRCHQGEPESSSTQCPDYYRVFKYIGLTIIMNKTLLLFAVLVYYINLMLILKLYTVTSYSLSHYYSIITLLLAVNKFNADIIKILWLSYSVLSLFCFLS